MNTTRRTSLKFSGLPLIEALEDRRLLSAVIGPIVGPIVPITPTSPVASNHVMLIGDPVHAEANQAFQSPLGTIQGLRIPAGYTLKGTIDWGDGSATSDATFTRLADGAIEVVGSHTYAGVGTDAISVTVIESNPKSTLAPILVVGTLKTKAAVISSPGGVTVEETADTPFTANVGSFSSMLSASTMTAIINWGDGTTSLGKILLTPAAPGTTTTLKLGGGLVVQGTHVYARSGSYLVHVSVTSRPTVTPPVTATSVAANPPIIIVVAEIDSVIDVLAPSPVATAV